MRGTEREDRENALSEVVGFILILAVIVSALSIWMTYVIPVNGRNAEIIQMNAVKDQFTNYKISLDSLWLNNQTGTTLSTSINLGTGDGSNQAGGLFLWLLNPVPSSATLSIQNPGDTIKVTSSSGTNQTFTPGRMSYISNNNYWIQQTYYYETGGVFLSQMSNASVCRISPPFSIAMVTSGGNQIAAVNLVMLNLAGGGSVAGSGPVRIDSMIQTPPQQIAVLQPNAWVNISVSVADLPTAQMWMNLLNSTRIEGNITQSSWYTFNVINSTATTPAVAYMNITGPSTGSLQDVYLTLQSVTYTVTPNNIASVLT
jgi:hypothetical protein